MFYVKELVDMFNKKKKKNWGDGREILQKNPLPRLNQFDRAVDVFGMQKKEDCYYLQIGGEN